MGTQERSWTAGHLREPGIESLLIAVVRLAQSDTRSKDEKIRLEAELFLQDCRNYWREMFYG